MCKDIIKLLKSDGFVHNTHCDAWDKGNTRVYFDDIDIIVVRFTTAKSQVMVWKNRIDGNMPVLAAGRLLLNMVWI